MTRVNNIDIQQIDNGYTVYVSYTFSSSKEFYKTEEEVIEAVATALSNNTAEWLKVHTTREELKEKEAD